MGPESFPLRDRQIREGADTSASNEPEVSWEREWYIQYNQILSFPQALTLGELVNLRMFPTCMRRSTI